MLAELLDHRNLNVTRGYYRVGEDRRRGAVDKVTAMQFDRHGNRIWRDARALLDDEHTRYAVGSVAVPYGTCTEPSNVAAGGNDCPVRFRCAGCDHFRTDISYLPDLTAYLDDLLRTRERLAAAGGADDWARAAAAPPEQEISKIRQLINRIKDGIEELAPHERARIDEAVAAAREHRAGPSAATCCSYINFFASRPVAAAWARAHPEIDGGILSQARALEVGEQIFGQLLR